MDELRTRSHNDVLLFFHNCIHQCKLCNQNALEISIYDFVKLKTLPSPLLTALEALRNHEYVLDW